MEKSELSLQQKRFGRLMAAARKTRGLKQTELAARLGRNQSYIAKYEGGDRRLGVVEFVAVARAMGVDPLKIMSRLLKKWPGQPKSESATQEGPKDST